MCNLKSVAHSEEWTVAGLFAGVGGIEVGLERAGMRTELLCESWDPARAVLMHRFPGVPLAGDVQQLDELPPVDLVTAGFPCTDLSQAGRVSGITGQASRLVSEVFRLVHERRVPWIMLENVRNMLVLDRGSAMRYLVYELEQLGYSWAYRLVDSRFSGVPQRRHRLIMVATVTGDPREVLFADNTAPMDESELRTDAYGFYWTEGSRGLGWAHDAVPTLKGGSTIGIASPPAVWNLRGDHGRRIVIPSAEEAECLQGLSSGWTEAASQVCERKGTRWKLIGNAVTVGVAEWVGGRMITPGTLTCDTRPLDRDERWPLAAWGAKGQRWEVEASLWPIRRPYTHLSDALELATATPLSSRAAGGFLNRAKSSNLRFSDGFLEDVAAHIDAIVA